MTTTKIFLVLLAFIFPCFGQNLEQFTISLNATVRETLLGHLSVDQLETLFLTRRQKLAWKEEKYLRSLGYLPFSSESNSLVSRRNQVEVSSPKLKFVENFQEKSAKPSLPINRDGGSDEQSGSFIRATPSITNTGQFTNLQLLLMRPQTTDENTREAKTNIEALLNRLSINDQQKFLEQFSRLTREQQQYAFKQFISSPLNVQEFALNQFHNLDPEVLKISIDREIDAENGTEPIPRQQQQSNSLTQPNNQISVPVATSLTKHRFQTNFS